MNMHHQNILLIVTGGIAAFKVPEVVRLFKKQNCGVRCILTKGGAQFVTPMTLSALSENEVYTDLWSLKDEREMGHIELSRQADVILIAPASANIIAKMAHGTADDLASTTLLAANKPIYIAPAMNYKMWENPATQANIEILKSRGIHVIEPTEGDMACGEYGVGRMQEPENIASHILHTPRALSGMKAFVTAGPTYETIDPVRFLGNRSSGKQGYAIASTLSRFGADVTLISGPTNLAPPKTVKTIHVNTAAEMMTATEQNLPADIGVFAAAVSDWTIQTLSQSKIKKIASNAPPNLKLIQTPDILKTIAGRKDRPTLMIGFAAETEDLIKNAAIKRSKKNCDWILANNVHKPNGDSVFGADNNQVHLITEKGGEDWPLMSKEAIANKLTETIVKYFESQSNSAIAAE